jgi:hypothetical protein
LDIAGTKSENARRNRCSAEGVPKYSNAGSYEGADETSFRGAFLSDCGNVLSSALLSDAWNRKLPDEAVAYGRSLLTAADTAVSLTKDSFS